MKKKIKKWGLMILVLLTIQTITYLTISKKELENKLLTDQFGALTHSSDSVFIRDFFVTDCMSGESDSFISHDLKQSDKDIKDKLRVKFLAFQDKSDYRWDNPEEEKYMLVYHTWARHPDWITIFGLFSATQIEDLIVGRKYHYHREVHYRWILFFWVKGFEFLESREKR